MSWAFFDGPIGIEWVGGIFSDRVLDVVNEIKRIKKEYKNLLNNVEIEISTSEAISRKIEADQYAGAEIFFFAPG